MSVPSFFKAKDLMIITGKSRTQSGRDLTKIKELTGKKGRQSLVTIADVSGFYGITMDEIISKYTVNQ